MAPPINPPNYPPTQQTIHPSIGGRVSTDFKSSNRIKISRFLQVLLNFYWFGGSLDGGGGGWGDLKFGFGGWCGDDRDDVGMTGGWQGWHGDDREDTMAPPINPPNHQTIHSPIGGGVSTDFKSSNRIKISQFVQVLLNFYWFRGVPPRAGVGVGGGLNGGLGRMWGWQEGCGDDMGMTGMTWGWRGR